MPITVITSDFFKRKWLVVENKNKGVTENGRRQWLLLRDKILLGAGLIIIAATFIATEFLNGPFHPEYLFIGLTLCGIGLTQGFDRSGRG